MAGPLGEAGQIGTKPDQLLVNFGPSWAKLGPHQPNHGRHLRSSDEFWPNLGAIWPSLAELREGLAERLSKFCQIWPDLGSNWTNWGLVGKTCVQTPKLVEIVLGPTDT